MNRDDTRKAAEVMLAYADRAEVQFRGHESSLWLDLLPNPGWNFEKFEYRIKPKPREGWVSLLAIHEEVNACRNAGCIHVIEVIDDA
jgi:hypothetical protein